VFEIDTVQVPRLCLSGGQLLTSHEFDVPDVGGRVKAAAGTVTSGVSISDGGRILLHCGTNFSQLSILVDRAAAYPHSTD
jgi:hypothetical protein